MIFQFVFPECDLDPPTHFRSKLGFSELLYFAKSLIADDVDKRCREPRRVPREATEGS